MKMHLGWNGLLRGLCCLCLLLSMRAQADITTGLWGHWPLDGSLADTSGNGRTLSSPGVGGAPVVDANGKYSACYSFNNTASAQMLWPGALDATPIAAASAMSFTGWINPSVLEDGFSSTAPHTIFRVYNSVSGADVTVRVRNKLLEVYYSSAAGNFNIPSTREVPLNQWSFVAATLEGTTLKLFLNGQAAETFAIAGDHAACNRMVIGAASNNTTPRGLTGKIDELRFYTRALSEADVAEVYAYQPPVAPTEPGDITTGLWGHWPLDGNLADISGNGRDLASVGSGGTPSSSASGQFSQCLVFDNTTTAQMLAPADGMTTLSATTELTFSAWVNPSQLQSGFSTTAPHTIMRLYQPTTGKELNLRLRDGKLDAYYTSPTANNATSFAIPQDQWTFVAVTQSSTSLKLYMNNYPAATFAITAGQEYNRLVIGAASNTTSPRGLIGKLDEMRFYTRALSADDIAAIYAYVPVEPTPEAEPDLSRELYGYWKFDGNWLDETANALDLTPVGWSAAAPTASSDGIRGTSYDFKNITEVSGGQQVLGPSAVDVHATSGVTMTAWIKPRQLQNGFTTTSPHIVAFLQYDGSTTQALQLRIRDGKLEAYYTQPSANNLSSLVVPLDTWSFIAVTQDGTELKLYLNDQSATFATTGNCNYTYFNIGAGSRLQSSNPRGVEGLLDEVRLYRRALSSEEIEMIHTFWTPPVNAAGNWAAYE